MQWELGRAEGSCMHKCDSAQADVHAYLWGSTRSWSWPWSRSRYLFPLVQMHLLHTHFGQGHSEAKDLRKRQRWPLDGALLPRLLLLRLLGDPAHGLFWSKLLAHLLAPPGDVE